MSDKYVEIKDTGFTSQYVNKNETTEFVSDKRSVAASINTGVTLDCYDVLFSNYDIFSTTDIETKNNVKHAYKEPGKIEVPYPTKEYPYIYSSNFTEVINKLFTGNTNDGKLLMNLFKREGMIFDLVLPYYYISKQFSGGTIGYSYVHEGNIIDLMENDIDITTFYKKELDIISTDTLGNIKDFSLVNYSNKPNENRVSDEQCFFKEIGENLIVPEQTISLAYKTSENNIVKEDIVINYGTALRLKRNYMKDIDNKYYAWSYTNENNDKMRLFIKPLNNKKYGTDNKTVISEDVTNEIFEANPNVTSISDDIIFYTNTDVLTEDCQILFIAIKKSKNLNDPYVLIDSSYNNNIEIHNIYKEKHSEGNTHRLILPDNSSLDYYEMTNTNNFKTISFGMFQDVIDNNNSYKKNIYSFAVDYVYDGKRRTYWLNEYEIERMLVSGKTSMQVIGNSLYLKNIVGETTKPSYQIRFDDNYPLLLRTYCIGSISSDNKNFYYLINIKNNSGQLKLYIQQETD